MQLLDIQKLQFKNKEAAERELLAFLQSQNEEDSAILKVQLNPKPESLNSLNGFISYENGERYFFKTHVEENERLSEYYKASLLAEAGYPVISAKQINHRPGKQIVLYEIVSLPTLFDLLKKAEDEYLAAKIESPESKLLIDAQTDLEKTIFEIYKKNLQVINSHEHKKAALHQLFYNRLQDKGRLGLFYKNRTLNLPDYGKSEIAFEKLDQLKWRINGLLYENSLAEIIDRAKLQLNPLANESIAAAVGHGDAHNGNVFVNEAEKKLYYFDPAFAGLHSILLDLVKPLFHNVFARWMYFPEEVSKEFELEFKAGENEIEINHNFLPSKLRLEHLKAKKEHLLRPVLKLLKEKTLLPEDWQDYLRSALFCCPFLTVNLFADYQAKGTLAERYSSKIKLLGLSMAVAFGSSLSKCERELSSREDSENKTKLAKIIDGIFDMELQE